MIATLALAACSDGVEVAGPDLVARPAPPDGPRWFVDGQYPTEEEYLDELGPVSPSIEDDAPTNPNASFSSDLSKWDASGRLGYRFGNVGSGNLEARLIKSDGSLINSGEDTWLFDQFLPKISTEWHSFNVSISTNNNTCDLVGKARLRGSNAAKLIRAGSLTTLWTNTYDKSAADVALPACPTREEPCKAASLGGPCRESGLDDDDSESGGGGGSGSGSGGVDGDGHGGESGCTLWLWKGYTSGDGGNTWSYAYSYYEWQC